MFFYLVYFESKMIIVDQVPLEKTPKKIKEKGENRPLTRAGTVISQSSMWSFLESG